MFGLVITLSYLIPSVVLLNSTQEVVLICVDTISPTFIHIIFHYYPLKIQIDIPL